MTETKEQFVETIQEQHIQQTIENMEWNDLLVYHGPEFDTWLDLHEVTAADKELIKDYFDTCDSIQTEHAGGFYSVLDDQFILLVEHEHEDAIGEWFSYEQLEWIKEEFTVDGEYFYIYNPTSFYITIQTINNWLEESREYYTGE